MPVMRHTRIPGGGIISLLLATAALLSAQVYVTGPQVLTFYSRIDDSDQLYGLYLPRKFDPAKAYPLVVSLHGSGSNHRLNLRRVFGKGNAPGESDVQASRYFPALPYVEFIVASPYARGSMGYQSIAEQDVLDVIADVKKRFAVDEDRMYLTGLSMGGGGTLWFGLTRPDLWAAIAPVCAGRDGMLSLAPNALNLPVHLFHGDADKLVPVERSRQWHKEFLALGVPSEYIEYPGVDHNSWDLAYKDANIFRWFSQHRRNHLPDRVRYVSQQYRYRSAYWVELDGFTPGTPASIDARFSDVNVLDIETSRLDGFTLKLAEHPKVQTGRPLRISVDGQKLETAVRNTISLLRSKDGWQFGRYEPTAGEKRAGAEGPIMEAVSARHLYVYGTADSPAPEELKRREREALFAANWFGSRPQARLAVSFFAAADKDVNLEQGRAPDLVLFGTKETNRVIRSYAGRLPLELKTASPDFGLFFIAHFDGRNLLVNSGLPYWTGIEQIVTANARVRLYAPNQLLVRTDYGDYALFKGSITNIVAQGRFDRQWNVPAGDAEKLEATGAVIVKRRSAVDAQTRGR